MHDRSDVVYAYDGSFDGFLCCVHSYYYSVFNPVDIVSEDSLETTLYPVVTIETQEEQVKKVSNAIINKMSESCFDFLQESLLTCLEGKEMQMLRYLMLGFKMGARVQHLVADDAVNALIKAHRHMERERHLYLGIVRFYKAEDVYISSIKPKNQILPLIAYHFKERFAKQTFMIYDETHGQALLYSKGQSRIIKAEGIELPKPSENERNTQRLWKLFYDTIAIKERYNPKCRMNFIPKRTWDRLTEMQNLCDNSNLQLTE